MNDCMTQEDAERMDASQAVQILKPLRAMMLDQNGCPISDAYFALGKAIEALKQQHGYWITLTDCSNEGVYCSHCRKKVYKRNYSNIMKVRSKFCPNCGFKMDMKEIEK